MYECLLIGYIISPQNWVDETSLDNAESWLVGGWLIKVSPIKTDITVLTIIREIFTSIFSPIKSVKKLLLILIAKMLCTCFNAQLQ